MSQLTANLGLGLAANVRSGLFTWGAPTHPGLPEVCIFSELYRFLRFHGRRAFSHV